MQKLSPLRKGKGTDRRQGAGGDGKFFSNYILFGGGTQETKGKGTSFSYIRRGNKNRRTPSRCTLGSEERKGKRKCKKKVGWAGLILKASRGGVLSYLEPGVLVRGGSRE